MQTQTMPETCPDCGAILDPGDTCQAIFDQFLVLEFTDPAYGAVHMLTVACFMIQHSRYSDQGLAWIEPQLRAYLEKNISPEQIRLQAAQQASQTTRKWKINRQPGARPLPKINWSITIADVANQYQDAASYRACVQEWARQTLSQMKPLLPA